MKPATQRLLKTAEEHLARFAFFTRDNPFLSSRAAFRLEDRHRRAIGELLEGKAAVDEWLDGALGAQLRRGLAVGCVPRDLQLVRTDEGPAVGVESVHAFVHGPVFWWLVSILWTIVVGRELDPELGDQVIGYRLARKFVSDHESHGVMFQEPSAAYDRWKRVPLAIARDHVGETLSATTLDIRSFYYAVDASPSQILAAMRKVVGAPTRSRQVVVLTQLLDALHSTFADRIGIVQPRAEEDLAALPLPVGLPSSRVLANVIMFLAVGDLVQDGKMLGAAAYADDVVVVSRDLPQVGDSAATYLSRLGVIDESEQLVAPFAAKLATFRVGLEKSSTALVRVVSEDEMPEKPEEPTDLDPYIEADPSPEWDGVLRTVLRVPYRRERMPRTIVTTLRRLVDEIRVGLDREEAASRLTELVDDLDSAALVAIRPYWAELLVAGLASLGPSALGTMTTQFDGVAASLVPPSWASSDLVDALHFGLRTSWIHAAAQALSVTTSRADRDAIAGEDAVLIDGGPIGTLQAKSIALYATRLRIARLISPDFVASPLAEFSDWPGPLIGEGSAKGFVEWSRARTVPQRRAMLMRAIGKAPRFVHLHEACLAVHLWMAPGSNVWLGDVDRVLRSQPLVDGAALDGLKESARLAMAEAPSDDDFSEKKRALRMRFALPCFSVREDQLEVQIAGEPGEVGQLAKEARGVAMRVILEAVSRDADVLVLPEWTLLPELLLWAMERAAQSRMLLIGGQTATIAGGHYSNVLWVGIPMADPDGRRSCLVPPPRPKKPLSPAEKQAVDTAGLTSDSLSGAADPIPVYGWRGANFASLLCYEFADAQIRTALRGRADVVTLSAVNRDWKYFENAQDSMARDNYCLSICVNTGRYPGTRIVRPSGSDKAIAAAIHGSEQPAILTRLVDLEPVVAARVLKAEPGDVLTHEPSDDLTLADYKPIPPSGGYGS
jgi:predicted amidohydrolase